MPLALVALGSNLDPERYEVIVIDGRLEDGPVGAICEHVKDALCLAGTRRCSL